MTGKFTLSYRLLPALMVLSVLVCWVTAQPSQVPMDSLDKSEVLKKAGSDWMDIGIKAYKRGFYVESEETLLRAREYFLYLSNQQRSTLEEYSEKAHEKALRLRKLRTQLKQADTLIKKGELSRAEVMLSKVESDHPVPEVIKEGLTELQDRLESEIRQERKQMQRLYAKSLAQYKEGEFQKARQGFSRVAESEYFESGSMLSAKEYISRIDSSKASESQTASRQGSQQTTKIVKHEESNSMLEMAAPDEGKQKSREQELSQKENIRRSYARAVVKDAIKQAEKRLKNGQYYKAKQSVAKAREIIKKHQDYLGEKLYGDFVAQLEQMTEKIEKERKRWLGDSESDNPWRM